MYQPELGINKVQINTMNVRLRFINVVLHGISRTISFDPHGLVSSLEPLQMLRARSPVPPSPCRGEQGVRGIEMIDRSVDYDRQALFLYLKNPNRARRGLY